MDQTSRAAVGGQHGVHLSIEEPPVLQKAEGENQVIEAAGEERSDSSAPAGEEAPRRRRRRGRRGGKGRRRKTAAGEMTAGADAPPSAAVEGTTVSTGVAAPRTAPAAKSASAPSHANGGSLPNGHAGRAAHPDLRAKNGRGRDGKQARGRERDRRGHRRGKPDEVRRPGDPVPSAAIWAGWSAARFGRGGDGD